MRQRPDYPDAVRTLNGLRRESGDENPRIHTSKQVRQRASHPFTRTDVDLCSSTGKPVAILESDQRVDPTGWIWHSSLATSSSSTTWWRSTDGWSSSKWSEIFFLRGVSLTSISDALVIDGKCAQHTALRWFANTHIFDISCVSSTRRLVAFSVSLIKSSSVLVMSHAQSSLHDPLHPAPLWRCPLRSTTCSTVWPSCRTEAPLQFWAQRSHRNATTPVDSEVNDAQIIGMLVSLLCTQERETSADPSRMYHSDTENSVQGSSSYD